MPSWSWCKTIFVQIVQITVLAYKKQIHIVVHINKVSLIVIFSEVNIFYTLCLFWKGVNKLK